MSIRFLVMASAIIILTGCPAVDGGGGGGTQVYFYNQFGWTNLKAYSWSGSTQHLGAWPGSAMTSLGENWYSIGLPVDSANIIFNGTGGQTGDLSYSGTSYYYYGLWYAADPRNSAPALIVDHGSTAVSTPVADFGGSFNLGVTVNSARALTLGTWSFEEGGGTPVSGTLSIGSNSIDLLSLPGWIVGETATLTLTVTNSNGTTTSTYQYEKAATTDLYIFTASPHSVSDPWTPMGAFYDLASNKTTYRIWSPDSSIVTLSINSAPGVSMVPMPAVGIYKSVYQYQVTGDDRGKQYAFSVNGTKVRDPYGLMVRYADQATQSTQNNVVLGRLDTASSNAPIVAIRTSGDALWTLTAPPALANREDSIIYEAHVHDLTYDSTWTGTATRGTYPAFVETGRTHGGRSIGLDHIKDLGITHVQLLPVYDFKTPLYNWGYDPQNWNIPEEQYSAVADKNDAAGRVAEFRAMVNALHANNLRVIMDVVYNHTADNSMFSGITSKYFTGANDSGTGNGINTGIPMVRRLIRDSLDHWVGNYGMDGFRFDLMGIFHFEAVEDWGLFLNSKYPTKTLLLYGEPWTGYFSDPNESQKIRMGTLPNVDSNAHIGVFNGKFRDNLKGNNDGVIKSFMFGSTFKPDGWWWGAVAAGSRGSLSKVSTTSSLADLWDSMYTQDPEQTINYISAHDNFGLWDKIYLSLANGVVQNSSHQVTSISSAGDLNSAQKVARFGMGVVLTSQGMPFIHAGDEILRTKTENNTGNWSNMTTASNWWWDQYGGTHNTYNAPMGVNSFKWGWKSQTENFNFFTYLQQLIDLRQSASFPRLTSRSDIETQMKTYLNYDGNTITPIPTGWTNNPALTSGVVVNIYGLSGSETLIVVYNPTAAAVILPVAYQLSGTWNKIFGDAGAQDVAPTTHLWSCESLAVTVFGKQ